METALNRRSFIKGASLGAFAIFSNQLRLLPQKTHILTLSFDDGFKKSFYKTADIFEEFGLKACFNVIASGHLSSFKNPDGWILQKLLGNFEDWNTLRHRGHEIMPHSWEHANLTRMPFEEAARRIDKCLDYFKEHLNGFELSDAVFNFPFNASTPELEKYTLRKVRAVRTGGESAINEIPTLNSPARLSCKSMGPGNIDNWIEKEVNNFIKTKGGWLILNTHGLDAEGWGPVSSTYLKKLLKRLVQTDFITIVPTGEVFKIFETR